MLSGVATGGPFEKVASELKLQVRESVVGICREGSAGLGRKSKLEGPEAGRSVVAPGTRGKPV